MTKKTVHNTRRKNREWMYKTIAILLPFIIAVLLELSLRVFGYGHDLDVFVPYPQNTEYVVFNPHASNRFFLSSRFAPSGNKEPMRMKKADNTLRIFVLGESTTIGFPYFHNGSFHRWLLYRLLHTYPDKHFEIVNLSLTAVNSYAVRKFAEEIVHYEPDAVLIYAGQNEYYGGLGVASTQSFGTSPGVVNALLQMRQFRIVQWLTNSYGALRQTADTRRTQHAEATRMELMIGRQQIPLRSELFENGLKQFEYNMDATLRILDAHQVPVFVSNVASNIKDLPPFISEDTDLENNAMHYYRLGQTACRNGEYEQAREFFTKAKDTDLLRFRAPEALNRLVEDLCARYPHAHFVDSRKALEDRAPHRLLGDELFTDHVHPNLRGYGIMSEAFYAVMRLSGLLPPSQREMTDEQLERDMPVSPVDSLAGELRIMQLKAHFPFYDSLYINMSTPEHTLEERLAARLFRREDSWMAVHEALYNAYIRGHLSVQAAKIAENTALEFAEDPAFYEQTAMVYGEAGHTTTAAFYLGRAFRMQPSFEKAHYLTVFHLMMDEPEEALPFLDYAITHNSGQMKMAELRPMVEEIAGLKTQLAEKQADVSLMNRIAAIYLRMENREGAAKYVREVLQRKPDNREAQEMNTLLNQFIHHDP